MNSSYPFAVSRIKACESSLIDQTEWNRLWEAGIPEALRLLHDMGYGHTAKNQDDVDALAQASVNEARLFIREITPQEAFTNLFLLQTDGHNIKAELKGLIQREEVSDILLPGGSIPLPVLTEAFEKDSYEAFPTKLREAVEAFDPSMPPRELSARIDEAVYAQIDETLRGPAGFLGKIESAVQGQETRARDLLLRYFRTVINFTNIRTILRTHVLGWTPEQTQGLIIAGGDLPDLNKAMSAETDQLPELLAKGDQSVLIKKVLNEFVKDHNITKVETAFERAAFGIIHNEYTDSFGLGPIINYLLQKEFEARTLRVMFADKRAGKNLSLADLGVSA